MLPQQCHRPTGRHSLSMLFSKLSFGLLLLALLMSPISASAGLHTAECRKLDRQVRHFQDVAVMASERGDELWLGSTMTHIERLETRLFALCPEYDPPSRAERLVKWTSDTAVAAGRAFVSFMTFGAY